MVSLLELDLFSVPEGTAIHFLLYSLTSIAKMVNHNYLWLKGLLSIKVNLKYAHLLHILKHDLVPALQVEEKGFILRIPIISIHNWYQNQGNFSNPEIAQILSSFRCDFGLNGRSPQRGVSSRLLSGGDWTPRAARPDSAVRPA